MEKTLDSHFVLLGEDAFRWTSRLGVVTVYLHQRSNRREVNASFMVSLEG